MNYYCKCCKYNALQKSNYERHLQTKKHKMLSQSYLYVTPKLPSVTPKLPFVTPKLPLEKNTEIKCKYCNKAFKYRSGLSRHIKYTCKKNKDEDLKELVKLMNEKLEQKNKEMDEIKNENKVIKNEINKREKQISKLSKKLQINNINNTNVLNNNIMNNNINIQLNSYNNTDLTLLNEQDYIECLKRCKNCVVKVIEKIHFNPNYPQNMNICISNIKENYLLMYEDGQWMLKDRNAILLRIYEDKEDILSDWVEENKDEKPKVFQLFERYVNMKEDNDELIKNLLKDVKIMMYNNRNKITCKEDIEKLEAGLEL